MAKKAARSRWRNPSFFLLFIISCMLIFVYVVGLFANPTTTVTTDTSNNVEFTPEIATARPTPYTVPTVDPAGPQLTLGQPAIQTNGLFQISIPEGYFGQRSDFDPSLARARSTFSDPNRLSVIEALLQWGVNYPSLQAVSDELLDNKFFFDAWFEYDAFTETNRAVGDKIVVDFNLLENQVNYLGRQIAWLDGDWLYMIRYVAPDNNPLLLDKLDELVTPTFIGYQDQRNTVPTYSAYVDQQLGFMVRHPGWKKVSGQIGGPVVLEDPLTFSRLTARQIVDTPLESLEAAQAYFTDTFRPGAVIHSAQVAGRQFGSGYTISYSDRDDEGNPISGLVVLLAPLDTQNLDVAELRLPVGNIDLLSLDEGSPYQVLRDVVDIFMVLPPVGVVSTSSAPVATEEATP